MYTNASEFCETDLIDLDRLWYTEYPEFTKCFEDTVLTWIPICMLLILLTISILQKRPKQLPLPFKLILILKYAGVILLLLLHFVIGVLISINDRRSTASVLAGWIKVCSFLLALLMLVRKQRLGQRSSSVLFFFWLFYLLCRLPVYYRIISTVVTNSENTVVFEFLEVIGLPIVVAEFVLAFVHDATKDNREKAKRPYQDVNPYSALCFSWFTPLIWTGYRRIITMQDLYEIPYKLSSVYCSDLWKKYFYNKPHIPLWKKLIQLFWKELAIAIFKDCIRSILQVLSVLFIPCFTDYFVTDQFLWKGVLYALGLFFIHSILVWYWCYTSMYYCCSIIRIRSTLINAIFDRAVRINYNREESFKSGELVNMTSVDVENIARFAGYLVIGTSALIEAILCFILMYLYLGPSSLAGVFAMILIIPLYAFTTKKANTLQAALMKLKDSRMKHMKEMLMNIKLIKLYAWEGPFMHRVLQIRNKENSILSRLAWIKAVITFFTQFTPVLVCLLAFVCYVLISPDNTLSAGTAFVFVTLLVKLKTLGKHLYTAYFLFIQAKVSVVRLNDFFNLNIYLHVPKRNYSSVVSLDIRDITASWFHRKEPVLSNINISVKKGELVAIVGQVGSGKSSLLSAILGEMEIIGGEILLSETLAHVPQIPWIQNATVRKNILFTKEIDDEFYNLVLDLCCLREDLTSFPANDLTEIGERGINISGGQKQRISLARALYQDRDIYLLDDTLSSVDAHVASAIFQNVISNKGLLKNKTRILVTNNLSVLSECDLIVVLQNGLVVERGEYCELSTSGGCLTRMLTSFIQDTFDANKEDKRIVASKEASLKDKSLIKKYELVKEEKMEVGNIKSDVYKKYLSSMGIHLVVLTFALYTVYRGLDIVTNVWLSKWCDDVDHSEGSRNFRLIMYVVFGLSQTIVCYISTVIVLKLSVKVATRLHNEMLFAVVKATMSYFDTSPLGRLLNRFSKDLDALDSTIPELNSQVMLALSQIIGTLILISVYVPYFLVAVVVTILAFYLVRMVCLKTMQQMQRFISVTASPLYSFMLESIQGLSSLRAYNVLEFFKNQVEERIDSFQNSYYNFSVCRVWIGRLSTDLANILLLVICFLLIFCKTLLTSGEVALIISYALATCFVYSEFVSLSSNLESALVAAERIVEMADIPQEATWTSDDRSFKSQWSLKGSVIFQDYSTRYREDLDLILRNISLCILPGQKVGIVGRTGSGKSSLVLSLFRIIESVSGKIDIDDLDISTIGLHDLRKRLTIIPQDPVLFNGSIRFNLDPNNEYSDDQLWNSLDRAHAKEFFKDGLDTTISEGGSNLSVGQRQLVCLARALLRKTKILVLDEATASVDLETDALVQETVRQDFKNSTVITIAHRIHTILDYDKVFIMDNGNIIEEGSPNDLMKNKESVFHSYAKEAKAALK